MQKKAKELSIQGLSITNHDHPSPATEPAGVLQLESFSFSPPINSADKLQNFVPNSTDHTNNLEHSTHDFLAHSNCYYNHNPEASSCYDHNQQQQQQQRWRRSENHDEEQERLMAQERRVRRLISNRESARRSRLRRRKQLEELQAQVLCLLADNHQLTDALNRVLESNYQLLQENAHLKHEASSFRIIIADLIALAAEDFPADDDRSGLS